MKRRSNRKHRGIKMSDKKSLYKKWLRAPKDEEGIVAYPSKKKGKGWHNEKVRHSLASKGVKTTRCKTKGEKSALTQAKVNYVLENPIDEEDFWGTEAEEYFVQGFNDYPQGTIKGDLFDHPDVKNPDELPKEHFDHYVAGLEEAQKLELESVKSRGRPIIKEKYEGKDAKEKAKELLTVSTWRPDEEPNPEEVEAVVEYEDGRTFLQMKNDYYEIK